MHRLTLIIGVIALFAGLIMLAVGGFPPAFVFLFWGAVIVLSIVFERYRYKPLLAQAPEGNWIRTSERFIDDQTGAPVTVFLDPLTGQRQYVKD